MHAHYKYMHYKTIRLFWQMLSKILYPMMQPRNLKMPTRLPFFTSHTAVDPSLSIQNNFDEKTLRHFGGQPGSLMCTVPHYWPATWRWLGWRCSRPLLPHGCLASLWSLQPAVLAWHGGWHSSEIWWTCPPLCPASVSWLPRPMMTQSHHLNPSHPLFPHQHLRIRHRHLCQLLGPQPLCLPESDWKLSLSPGQQERLLLQQSKPLSWWRCWQR